MRQGSENNGAPPLYRRVRSELSTRIERGDWRPGDLIPSEAQLAVQFGVSSGTVKRAVQSLVNENLLYRRQGKGTFVARANLDGSLRRFFRFADASGKQVEPTNEVRNVVVERAPGRVATLLNLRPGAPTVKIERLRRVAGTPIMVEDLYLPRALFPGLEKKDLTRRILYEILEEDYGRPVLKAQEFLEPRLGSKQDARLLQIREGAPVIFIERITLGFNAVPIEYRRCTGRGDKYRYFVELR